MIPVNIEHQQKKYSFLEIKMNIEYEFSNLNIVELPIEDLDMFIAIFKYAATMSSNYG